MRPLILSLLTFVSLNTFGQLNFEGNRKSIITVTPPQSAGLEAVYVVDDTEGVKATYTSSGGRVVWYRYSKLGGAYAETINNVAYNGNESTVTLSDSDMGYIVEEDGRQHCFWVVDYSDHILSLDGLQVSPDSQCDRTVLIPEGKGERINYYTINGAARELSRELKLAYRTLSFDQDAKAYRESTTEVEFGSLSEPMTCPTPLCNTEFTLSGDRFLSEWGQSVAVTSQTYTTIGVEAKTWAEQKTEEYDNEQKVESEGLGGSAPCEITFSAAVSDAAVFREWQFSHTPEFEDVFDRYNSEEVTRVFDQNGATYVRFVCANDAGTCNFEGDVYTIDIGESRLECPNAFSPANQDGVNDLWKVSYRSIVSFECHIFNRWGKKLATLTHPSQGWDGRTGSKFVPSGVYYYVIKARGADGKKYDLSGDINIINSRTNPRGSGDVE